MSHERAIVVGGGPAGLTAAYELLRHGIQPVVLEASDKVGGIARTETYKGYRFDIGGHRFYTKVDEVTQLWKEMLGDEFIRVRRLSRIFYDGRFFSYPLSAWNVVSNLGLVESARILASYFKARLRPLQPEESFEQWVINRFGERLYETFFKTYTEKVWGIPCSEIRADWAAQRIKGLSLVAAAMNAVFGFSRAKSLIEEFDYPRLGPGQMWERFQEKIELHGGQVLMKSPVIKITRDGQKITSVTARRGNQTTELVADHYIASMPLSKLLLSLDPPPPKHVVEAAKGLKYRDFLIVTLIINQPKLFPDNWIYVHTPEVRVGRIQNFKNWSAEMVPDQSKTCLGMEYFCSRGDDLWEMDDAKLFRLATREIDKLGLANGADVEDGCVVRQPKAYPVYDAEYRAHLAVIQEYLQGFENLQTIGRAGMHRYNNQDHSMLCGLYAARNVAGAQYDLWDVNTERSYYEEHQTERRGRKPTVALEAAVMADNHQAAAA